MTVSKCKTILLLVSALITAQTVSAQSFYEREPSRYDVEMHFDIDSVGPPGSRGVALRLPGTLNGRRATFTLDTGASTSVISPQLLDRYGLRLLDDSVSVEGMDTVTVQRAIADSLTIGLLTLRNVPFLVASVETGIKAYDQYLSHLQLVIGRPLLEVLGKTTVDFDTHLITAPRRPKRKQKRTRRSNLQVVDNVLMLTANDTLRLIPDFGATHSALGHTYYEQNTATVEAAGHADTVSYMGLGGIVTAVEYTVNDFPLRIDRKTVVLPSITVHATNSYESRLGMDFFSRQRRVVFDLRRWRLSVIPVF